MPSRSLLILLAAVFAVGCNSSESGNGKTGSTSPSAAPAGPRITELKKDDVKVGTGVMAEDGKTTLVKPLVAESGDRVYMLYRGTLTNGKEFDSNMSEDKDVFTFVIGEGQVIKGWDQGIPGMKVGGERKLSIPSDLGYGAQGAGENIPPNSDLLFDVKLLYIVKKGQDGVFDYVDLKQGTGPAVKKGDRVTVHYTGKFLNGRKFDSSLDRKEPFSFKVGAGEVIKGWDYGVLGMKKGGKREIILPPAIAYGPGGTEGIPANAALHFTIEVLSIN